MTQTSSNNKPKLLYVDDERANLTAFRVLLRDRYDVLTAENAEDAYRILKEQDIPLVVSDQRMPGMTGTELLAKVAIDFPDCARMILTGYSDIDAVIDGINRSQIYYYFKKPWNESEVRLTLDNALEYVMTRRRLIESEQRFRSTFEHAGVGIAHLKSDGTIVRTNSKLQEFLGISGEDLTEQQISTWFHGIGADQLERTATGNSTMVVLETSFSTPLGDKWGRVALTASQMIRGDSGYFIIIVDDLTERKQIEDERDQLQEHLRQSQKLEAIGSLAGGIAHDFNNLLTPIIVYSEIIQQKAAHDDALVSKLQSISKAALSAKQLTSQLLTFSRKQVLEMKSCELNEVIGSVLDILNRTIRENIQIIQRLAPEDIFVTADRGQLVQIILNLIVNAQDAILANGTVTIETSEDSMDDEIVRMNPGMIPGRYALLAVSDSGSGMDDETLTHIFEPFYTTKQAGHGTGLGLATVYGIIKQHDGFVNVISRPGLGTVFRIYLPINAIQKQTTDIKCDSSWSERKGSGTILVVDDNLMVLELITDVLKDAGYSVHAASSPRNALEVAGQLPKQISLLLTDLIMPGMSGNELFEQLSQLQPDLKVMYVSGYASKVHVRGGCLEDGVNFLPKPFTRQELLERVQKLI